MNGTEEPAMKGEVTRPWYAVNKTFLPIKAFYFSVLAGIGALLPFIALYMRQIGLNESETGIIYGLMPFVGFLVRPLIGAFSDRSKHPKTTLSVCSALSALFYVLIVVVPKRGQSHEVKVSTKIVCTEFDSYIRDCIKKKQSEDSNCPDTLVEVLQSFQRDVRKSLSLESTNGHVMNNMSYSYLDNTTQGFTEDSGKCQLMCHVSSPDDQSTACFTNSSEDLTNTQCAGTVVPIPHKSNLTLTLMNIPDITQREVKKDRQSEGNEKCRDFDLKHFRYNNSNFFQMFCLEEVTLSCVVKCDKPCMHEKSSDTFWLFFVIFLFANIAFAPVVSLGDAMAYNILGEENRNRWGKQRLFGTVGFALFALGTTTLTDRISSNLEEKNFLPSFIASGFFFFATALLSCFMPISPDVLCGNMLGHVKELLRHTQIVVFFLVVLLFGFYTGAIEAFLFWYLAEDLQNTLQIIPGLCLVFNCTAETLLLFIAGYVIKRLGHLNCIYVVFIFYAIRFLSYSFLTNPWAVLPVELTHGVTYGICWATATSYASLITPPGLSGTVQGTLSGVHFGFGKGIGSLVTGWLYKPLGFRWIFRLYSILAIVFLAIYIVINKCFFQNKTQYGEKKTEEREAEMEELAEKSSVPDKDDLTPNDV